MKNDKPKNKKKSKAPIAIGVVAVLGIYGMFTNGSKDKNDEISDSTNAMVNVTQQVENTTQNINTTIKVASKSLQTNTTETDSNSKINYENYLNIKMGSSYDDVRAVLGEGKEINSTESGGIKSVVYDWNESDKSLDINVIITNNIVSGKSQYGLNNTKSNVNMDQYNKLSIGMSYNDARSIIGDGILSNESSLLDNDSKIYTWTNEDFSSVYLTFINDKLSSMSQVNLNKDVTTNSTQSNTTQSIFADENTTSKTTRTENTTNSTVNTTKNTTSQPINTTEKIENTTSKSIDTTAAPVQETQAPEPVQTTQAVNSNSDRIVYWTPNGKSYHFNDKCSTLTRSKTILNGPLSQCPKSDPCDKCAY